MKILSFRKYNLVLSKIKKHITFLPTYFILFKKISLRLFSILPNQQLMTSISIVYLTMDTRYFVDRHKSVFHGFALKTF